jgi:hypothetical protein
MVQIHLDKKAANLRFENRMDSSLFAREHLLQSAHSAAHDHVQVTVVDGTTGYGASPIIVRDEGEVQRLFPGRIQVIRTEAKAMGLVVNSESSGRKN